MTGPAVRGTQHGDGVVVVSLDRPDKANALNAQMVQELSQIFSASNDDGTRVLALRGNGRNFSAGFDFSTLDAETDGDLLLRFVRIELLLQAVYRAPFATVGFAHGRNFGAGVDLLAACRRRFASADATFRMPGLQFGLVLGARRFAEIVGESPAHAVLWSSSTIDARRALALGFIEEIVDPGDWEARVDAIAASGRALDPAGRRALCARDGQVLHADLSALVVSASAPGLKQRIREYLARQSG